MNRALPFAILFSLALHAVLLFGLSLEHKTGQREPPPARLEARLVEPEPPAAAPAAPGAPPAPPRAAKRERPLERKKPEKQAVRRKPAPTPQLSEPDPVREPEPRLAPVPVARPAPQVVEEPAPAPPSIASAERTPSPAGPSAEQLEAVTREQYRLALINAARRHNRYPPLARENNWEGEVLVRMEIGVDGAVALSVQRSSRHELLDRQALDMFRRAQAQVPLPASLRGKALSFELKAIYSLRDQGSG